MHVEQGAPPCPTVLPAQCPVGLMPPVESWHHQQRHSVACHERRAFIVMQRIARTPLQQHAAQAQTGDAVPHDVSGLNEALDRLRRLLRGRVSDAVLSVFARPAEREPGWVDWLSNLEGQPVPLISLRETQRRAARARLDERLQLIRQELDELTTLEPSLATDIAALRLLVAPPADEAIYVVNGEPVMTFWGPGRPKPAITQPVVTEEPAANLPPVKQDRRRLWPWLLLLLVLLLAGLLFWWWYSHRKPPTQPQHPANTPTKPAAPRPDPEASLRAAIEAADCPELARLLEAEPLLQDKADPSGLLQIANQKLAACKPPEVKPPEQPAEKPPEPPEPARPPPPDPEAALRAAIEAADCRKLAALLKTEPLLQDKADPSGLLQIANQKLASCRAESLQARIKAAGRDCTKLAALREKDPDLKVDDPKIKGIRSRLDASLDECRRVQAERERKQKIEEQRQVEERKQKQEEQKRQQEEQQRKQAMADCPGVRPPEKAPQVVLVFDASGSMNWDVNMTHQQVLQVEGRMMLKQRVAETLGQMLGVRGLGSLMPMVTNVPSSRKRITAAKEATRLLVQSLPADVSTGLVLVNNCPAASPAGFYAPANRPSLLAQINGIQARGGTPLGDGIRRAAAMVDGVNRDAVMVVLSDGEDSCGANPCAVAQQIARSKPRLKINVVDIQSEGTAHCLAQATGGRFYSARSADQIISVTREAGQDALTPAHCRKQ